MTNFEQRLVDFALTTLSILEGDKDWDDGTLDKIAADALSRELARRDPHDGLFLAQSTLHSAR